MNPTPADSSIKPHEEHRSTISYYYLPVKDLGFSPSFGIMNSVGIAEAAGLELLESDRTYTTAAQHGLVDQESRVDFVDESQFHDAPEELSMFDARSAGEPREESEERLDIHQALEDGKTTADKEILAQSHKKEKEMLGRELYYLQWQLATMAKQQLFRVDKVKGLLDCLLQDEKEGKEVEIYASDTPLQLMIADCSKLIAVLKRAVKEQLQSEGTIREIHAILFNEDHLSPKYNLFLSEIDQLRQCSIEVLPEVKMPENAEYGAAFDVVHSELLDHKRIENGFIEKLTEVEIENNKLLEQLHMANERIDVTSGEVKKLKMEVEQESIRCSIAREKLGIAVMKGKGLVQQRDSLKHLLAEKSTEVDTLSQLLTEKTTEIDSLNKLLSGKMTEIYSLNQLLTEKTTELDSLNAKNKGVIERVCCNCFITINPRRTHKFKF